MIEFMKEEEPGQGLLFFCAFLAPSGGAGSSAL